MEHTAGALKLILQKVREGTATEMEKETLAAYLKVRDADPDLLLPYADWEQSGEEVLPAGLRERLLARIRQAEQVSQKRQKILSLPSVKRMISYLPKAAAVLILLLAGYHFFQKQLPAKEIKWSTVTAGRGQIKSILLPDSSEVILNAGSEISFPARFNTAGRMVKLKGEAFFEVKKDPSCPFVVESAALKTRVLGTAFNIKAYPGEREWSVAVAHGKVRVTAMQDGINKQEAVLTKGQKVVYAPLKHNMTTGIADTLVIAGWKEQKLVFENTGLEQICAELGRYYNVNFRANDPSLLSTSYSVTFTRLSLAEVLYKLELLGDMTFRQQNDIVIITRKTK